ncbi:hypothetical protein NL676_017691 [Syzygium grande]|nr:hypothetical protein NL676_017691 [Syzygium grande]
MLSLIKLQFLRAATSTATAETNEVNDAKYGGYGGYPGGGYGGYPGRGGYGGYPGDGYRGYPDYGGAAPTVAVVVEVAGAALMLDDRSSLASSGRTWCRADQTEKRRTRLCWFPDRPLELTNGKRKSSVFNPVQQTVMTRVQRPRALGVLGGIHEEGRKCPKKRKEGVPLACWAQGGGRKGCHVMQ